MNTKIPCPDKECKNGVIEVYNAYSATPLVPKKEICDVCSGDSFIYSSKPAALAN